MKKKKDKIRAVIDTNLFISGLFADSGSAYQLQELWVKGAFELAVSDFTKTTEIMPKEADAYFFKAVICEKIGKLPEAIDAYRDFLHTALPEDESLINPTIERIKELEKHLKLNSVAS